MLRQVHIFSEKEHIFVKDFAIAFGSEELKNILETINKYMEMPIPGKIINRKIYFFLFTPRVWKSPAYNYK